MFSLYTDDVIKDIDAEIFQICLFSDTCVCYRAIKKEDDSRKLQEKIYKLKNWTIRWGITFKPRNVA